MASEGTEILLAELRRGLGLEGVVARRIAARLAREIAELPRLHPGLELDDEGLGPALVAHLAAGGADGVEGRAAELPVGDLALTRACARGDGRAIRRFEELYFGAVGPALRKMGLDDSAIDEITQAVRERLFVADGAAPPRIAGVAGQGDLRALVRIMAVRTALNARRRDRQLVLDDGPLLDRMVPAADPELATIEATGRAALRAAFEQAIAGLERRDRTILRMHLVQERSIDDIARVYRVHRATAARWLGRIRETLEREVRRRLRDALGREPGAIDSMVRLVRSRLELSFERVLASASVPD